MLAPLAGIRPCRSITCLLLAALVATLGMSSAGAASQKPTKGGELVVAYVSTVNSLNPNPYGASSAVFRNSLYDPLVGADAKGNPVPMLAQSWDLSPDGLTLTLHLRKGVPFSDGTRFDATAAIANINWFKDPATGLQGQSSWALVTPTAIDANTVQLALSQRIPNLLGLMSVAMVAKPGSFSAGIGTGPFTLVSFAPHVGITMKANQNYWGTKPYVDTVQLKEFADPTAASLAAQSGSIGILVSTTVDQVSSLESAGLVVTEGASPGDLDIMVNSTSKGITDPSVRRALSLAFDRKRFVQTILQGHGTPQSSIFPPSSPVRAAVPTKVTPFDLKGAKALLTKAGVKSLDLDIMSPTSLPTDQFLPIYKTDLAKIGVTLNIKPTDAATWAATVSSPGAIPALATHAYSPATSDPSFIFATQVYRPSRNASGFDDPAYAQMVDAANNLADAAARMKAYAAIDAYVGRQAFAFTIANPSAPSARQKKVHGYALVNGQISFASVWLSK